jgi:hypothetical protein
MYRVFHKKVPQNRSLFMFRGLFGNYHVIGILFSDVLFTLAFVNTGFSEFSERPWRQKYTTFDGGTHWKGWSQYWMSHSNHYMLVVNSWQRLKAGVSMSVFLWKYEMFIIKLPFFVFFVTKFRNFARQIINYLSHFNMNRILLTYSTFSY